MAASHGIMEQLIAGQQVLSQDVKEVLAKASVRIHKALRSRGRPGGGCSAAMTSPLCAELRQPEETGASRVAGPTAEGRGCFLGPALMKAPGEGAGSAFRVMVGTEAEPQKLQEAGPEPRRKEGVGAGKVNRVESEPGKDAGRALRLPVLFFRSPTLSFLDGCLSSIAQ
ncbi:hypothetical protein NDU88_001166 [Pleurodeles waltl]|uniref:Uncharacterized protein n=1 Tax=Pleurodeles waltl TaxID=8319 RepID=A0AAV7M0A7_PLEWA|nr:hypothetical protein NDU88_001166 [Pleurodeles waltl]